jgi:hypothetical protein
MMRKILTFVFALACFASSAQSDATNTKLTTALSANELSALTEDDKLQLEFYASKGFRIHESGKPGENYPLLSSFLKGSMPSPNYASLNQENFNPLMFNFGERSEHQFFTIDGTDKVVQIYEAGYCAMRYQQYKVTKENTEKHAKK